MGCHLQVSWALRSQGSSPLGSREKTGQALCAGCLNRSAISSPLTNNQVPPRKSPLWVCGGPVFCKGITSGACPGVAFGQAVVRVVQGLWLPLAALASCRPGARNKGGCSLGDPAAGRGCGGRSQSQLCVQRRRCRGQGGSRVGLCRDRPRLHERSGCSQERPPVLG